MSDAYIAPNIRINGAYTERESLFETWATLISRDGVFIRCKEPFPRDTRVSLKFAVLFDGPQIITGEGVVLRSDFTVPGGMEVRFENLSHDSIETLNALVQHSTEVETASHL